MADVQFEEEPQYISSTRFQKEKPLFIRLVLSMGFVATDQQAEYVLLGLSVAMLIFAFLAAAFFSGSSVPHVPQSVIDATMKIPHPAVY